MPDVLKRLPFGGHAERMQVPAIIRFRPMVSKSRPIVSGPIRLPAANASRYQGADFALTPYILVSTSV